MGRSRDAAFWDGWRGVLAPTTGTFGVAEIVSDSNVSLMEFDAADN